MEALHFPQSGGVCKESRKETGVHSAYSPQHALMHDGNALVEWEGKLEDTTTWDAVSLSVNYLGCHYSVDWTTELDYWTGLLDWTTGLDY